MKTYKLTEQEMKKLATSTVGERINFFRLKAKEISSNPEKFDVPAISIQLNVSSQTILNIEKSIVGISFEDAYKLSSIIGFPIAALADSYYELKNFNPIIMKISDYKVRYYCAADDLLTKEDYAHIYNMPLAEKIEHIRKTKYHRYTRKQYTIEAVSKRAGLIIGTYYSIENGTSKSPTFDSICGIAQALGVPLYVLADKTYSTPVRIKVTKSKEGDSIVKK